MENAQPEPSMEEILASIRRIISEDDEEDGGDPSAAAAKPPARPSPAAPAGAQQAAPKKPESKPAPKPAAQTSEDDDGAGSHLETEDVEMIKKNAAAETEKEDEAILAETSAAAASKAFQSLSQTVKVSNGDGRTLEDIVIEMLRPMVKDWLDANLPAIVEEKVEEEVQRVARRRR
ncbi:MAG: DUF2497 domain-containing protein [Parvularculaceae bacterium]